MVHHVYRSLYTSMSEAWLSSQALLDNMLEDCAESRVAHAELAVVSLLGDERFLRERISEGIMG